jgi:hypothetical protein
MSHVESFSERDWILYLEGKLNPDRLDKFNAMLAKTPAAQKELQQYEKLIADFEELPMAPVPESCLEKSRDLLFESIYDVPESEDLHHIKTPMHSTETVPLLRRNTDKQNRKQWFYWPGIAAAIIIGIFIGKNGFDQVGFNDNISADKNINSNLIQVGADGASQTKPWEGTPSSRKYAVQGLDVSSDRDVKILLDETSSYEINGQAEDVEIQEYLSYIIRNDANSSRRLKAVKLLEESGLNEGSKGVMVYALSHDPDLLVRTHAFNVLLPHLGDRKVRQAFIKAMMDDPSPAIRTQAMNSLGNKNSRKSAEEIGRR